MGWTTTPVQAGNISSYNYEMCKKYNETLTPFSLLLKGDLELKLPTEEA